MNCSELPPRIYESLKMLCCLAVAKRPLLANEIAIATEIPAAQAPKVLQQLRWAGFVGSRRGPTGGFWLVRPPQRIRVIDVYSFSRHRIGSKSPTQFCSLWAGSLRLVNRRLLASPLPTLQGIRHAKLCRSNIRARN